MRNPRNSRRTKNPKHITRDGYRNHSGGYEVNCIATTKGNNTIPIVCANTTTLKMYSLPNSELAETKARK
jgi:hypothetical protein